LGDSTQKAMEIYFLVSLKIMKCGEPHIIGEELLLPAAKYDNLCVG